MVSEKIVSFLKDRLGDNLKLLFTPYKRDMWDSLEGIYKAAVKEGWQADILPLPYTYRDKDGAFGEWIVDNWSGIGHLVHEMPRKGEYDAILFHNFYDGCNKVTSVKPDYYTNKFVGLSKALCLVPYGLGVSGSIWPGTINADIVFAENDNVVKSIMDEARQAGMNDNQLKYFMKRFAVVGSTKCDLDLNQTIPGDWKDKINGKKVVLFATSLVPLLKSPIEEMQKYSDTLEELASHDQIVIWRPHPLTLGTIRAMIPQSEFLYSVMRREFITRDNVIIDETDDYRKAFSIADVLYSVPSSLATVWKETGKEFHQV